jgi:hypothetical protein
MMVLAVIFKISQDDPYTGFAIYLLISVSLVFYANNYMNDNDDNDDNTDDTDDDTDDDNDDNYDDNDDNYDDNNDNDDNDEKIDL